MWFIGLKVVIGVIREVADIAVFVVVRAKALAVNIMADGVEQRLADAGVASEAEVEKDDKAGVGIN